jgi:plasmid stabilization system protein ParE
MAYKVIFAPTAIARLEDIVRYIAADDPAAAKTFAMRLLERADLLSEFPELGTSYRKPRMSDACGAILISSTIAYAEKAV